MLRYFFLLIAIGGFSSILFIIFQPRTHNYIKRQIKNTASTISFHGKTPQGKSFTIKAQKAYLGENKKMHFKNAQFVLYDQNPLSATSSHGSYDMKDKKIYLSGLVKARYGKNCFLATKSAKINYQNSTLETLHPVRAYVSPDIRIDSKKFWVTSDRHLVFSKNVKILLTLKD